MRCLSFFITAVFLMINPLNIISQEERVIDFYDSPWITDTIDFFPARVILSVPESSVRHSREQIFKGHGKIIYYPLKYILDREGIWNVQIVYIEYLVMTSYDRLIKRDSIDVELWNSFNSGLSGSRSYICNGLYTRIDILECGIVVYYENLEPHMAEIANRIIKTVTIGSDRNIPIFKERKKVPPT